MSLQKFGQEEDRAVWVLYQGLGLWKDVGESNTWPEKSGKASKRWWHLISSLNEGKVLNVWKNV